MVLLQACGVSRFVPSDEYLYTGGKLTLSEGNTENTKEIRTTLNGLLRPAPNSKFLGTRLGLYYHYKVAQGKAGPITKWLNKKFGQEPVYLSDVSIAKLEELLLNRLDNQGYFYSEVRSRIDSTQHFAGAEFTVDLSAPYTLERFHMEVDSSQLQKAIAATMDGSVLKQGARFDLDLLKFERKRIDAALKKKGYYNFNPDFLIFEADTNQYTSKKFDLFLRLKKQLPQRALIPYRLDSITVYPNYSVADSASANAPATIDGLDFYQDPTYFKPEKLAPYLLLQEGQWYDPDRASTTSRRLSAIGSYKYVNIRHTELDTLMTDGDNGALATDIFLSPLTKRSLRAEVKLVSKSNGFAGPGLGLTYTNRNLFKGGEVLV